MAPETANGVIWAVAAGATAGVIVRPFRLPEAIWAVAGAALLIALGLMPLSDAAAAVGRGLDVYLFLIGMMLMSETARREGLFDWVAAAAVNHAKGSSKRLFLLVYLVGVVVTTFLSNDATAVVMTPAVFAAARKAEADPLPFLFICAFIANAASFVLPISNPANLVLYGGHMPPLGPWLASFALPSLAAIVATYVALRFVEGRRLAATCAPAVPQPTLSAGGWTALGGIVVTALALLVVSALDAPLGAPTCVLGVATTLAVTAFRRRSPWPVVKDVSWAVLPLVAGLFILVEAVGRTGLIEALAATLSVHAAAAPTLTAAVSGGLVGIVSNLMNNLPAGLIASTTIAAANPPQSVVDAMLIGVDLGPNLSITGSLATILWLSAIRREGEHVGFWRFLKVGAVVMPPALILAIAVRLLI
ncbi:arsenic transporter [Segnochrobactrum spirostomi]|uniref:Arsenic transporter n=1 Tax=Segnochrobactrum spirostomi TaxID=2608987 RepID=A0A6A7Y8I7_9HYPH|nr:arsenic transporter [Segnochrobactrum spirostomi]MQT14288.1 arsenic transporter [Segnochrobactrum spirostomi]